ncbi:MAG: chorismate-binding protein [Prevotella sp.]
MAGFALYRLPRQTRVRVMMQTQGDVETISGCEGLNGREGFVFAPFCQTSATPLLLLKPDWVEVMEQDEVSRDKEILRLCDGMCSLRETGDAGTDVATLRECYGEDFCRFHKALNENRFCKLVLARCEHINAPRQSPIGLFARACRLYPRMFVALVSTPQSGTWLMATPETLLSSDGRGCWNTVALAGTMTLDGDNLSFDNPSTANVQDIRWSQKNIQEQRYVATYIRKCLERYAVGITEDGPNTSRAANLVHLRSDFGFRLNDDSAVGNLIGALHPTPAVCGITKDEARQFIIGNESAPRRYYSGFAGELLTAGGTNLFVSLRCMELLQSGYDLYAGGGILKDSEEQSEWEETVAKMATMREIIFNGK